MRGWTSQLASPATLLLAKCALSCIVLFIGFAQVSDDDYSRTVIAEQFAHAPRLDPSGTSWLPFPFWVHGTSMLMFGRSLATAQATAFVLGAASPLLVFFGLRAQGVSRAWLLALLPFASPWLSLLSVATVPEALTAGLSSAALLGLSARGPLRPRDGAFGLALLCACLSRYDAWPIALSCAALVVIRMRADSAAPRARTLGALVLALSLAGPLLWLLWNARAHGDALHFLARVSRFRRAEGQAEGTLLAKALFFPRALVTDAPDIAATLAVALFALSRSRELRARWGGVLVASALTFVFLIAGSLGDGAPTHHAARALVLLCPPLYAAGLDSAFTWLSKLSPELRRRLGGLTLAGLLAASLLAQRVLVADLAWQSRATQVRQGEQLRAALASTVLIAPCEHRYDHLAIIAAYGAPEKVTLAPVRVARPGEECTALVLEPAPMP